MAQDAAWAREPPVDSPTRPSTPCHGLSHSQEYPGVPVVESLTDLWLVSKLQRERKQGTAGAQDGGGAAALARRELEAKKAEDATKGLG